MNFNKVRQQLLPSSNANRLILELEKIIVKNENCEQLTTAASDTRLEKIFSSDRHLTAVNSSLPSHRYVCSMFVQMVQSFFLFLYLFFAKKASTSDIL